MKATCPRCGSSQLDEMASDLPFRLDAQKILVVKQVPSTVCASCGEIMLDDPIMARIDRIIEQVRDLESELEVVKFAA